MGGIALGEMFHRAGWLIRDTTETGKAAPEGRAPRDAPRSDHRRQPVPERRRVARVGESARPQADDDGRATSRRASSGTARSNERAVNSHGQAVPRRCASATTTSSRRPSRCRSTRSTSRCGSAAGRASRKRRCGAGSTAASSANAGSSTTEFLVAQAYDYQSNGIFDYGGQSVVAGVSHMFRLSDSTQPRRLRRRRADRARRHHVSASCRQRRRCRGRGRRRGVKRTYDFGPGARGRRRRDAPGAAGSRSRGSATAASTSAPSAAIEGITAAALRAVPAARPARPAVAPVPARGSRRLHQPGDLLPGSAGRAPVDPAAALLPGEGVPMTGPRSVLPRTSCWLRRCCSRPLPCVRRDRGRPVAQGTAGCRSRRALAGGSAAAAATSRAARRAATARPTRRTGTAARSSVQGGVRVGERLQVGGELYSTDRTLPGGSFRDTHLLGDLPVPPVRAASGSSSRAATAWRS